MNKSFLYFLLFIVVGCKKIEPPSEEYVDRQFWRDALAVTEVKYIAKSGGVLNLDVHLVGMKNAATIHDYPTYAFKSVTGLVSGTTNLNIDSVSVDEVNQNLPFQTIVLIDETPTGWGPRYTDGFFDAINRLNKLCKNENNQTFGIGFYARDEFFGIAPVNYYPGDLNQLFDHTEEEILAFAAPFYSAFGVPQSSSLYDAINSAADKLIAHPLSSNQSITVIMGSNDDGMSSIDYNTLFQKCLTNNIKVNLISSDVPSYSYFQLSLLTGGFIADNSGTTYSGNHSSRTAESVIFHLYDLLAGNYKKYILHCSAIRSAPWSIGTTFNGYLEAHYFLEITGNYFEDDLYDDYQLNQYIPVSLKVQ